MSSLFQVSLFLGIVVWLGGLGFSKTVYREDDVQTPLLTIKVFNHAKVLPHILSSAQIAASSIFRQVGVKTLWFDCSLSSEGTYSHPACDQPLEPATVIVRLVPTSPATKTNFGYDTLGITAQPEEGTHATAAVFYDRVAELARSGAASLDVILGYAVAHEIGHLLLGSNSHSAMGVMRAKWSRQDLGSAADGGLLFTAHQAVVIREAVFRR